MEGSLVLMFLHLSLTFGEMCTSCANYKLVKNINPEIAVLVGSFKNLTSPYLAMCGSECSRRTECLAAIFDDGKKLCGLYNRSIGIESGNKSAITLLRKEKADCDDKVKLMVNSVAPTTLRGTSRANATTYLEISTHAFDEVSGNTTMSMSTIAHTGTQGVSTESRSNLDSSKNTFTRSNKDSSRMLKTFTDCQEAFENNHTTDGVYTLKLSNSSETVEAMCHFNSAGWTVFQARLDGKVDFFRNWTQYVKGFGSASGEYWLGLENIYQLTKRDQKLLVYLQAHDGEVRTAEYKIFAVGNTTQSYALKISGYNGSAGDSLLHHNGARFSTFDKDNEKSYDTNCGNMWKGGWWYTFCALSNLNGIWYSNGNYSNIRNGAYWSQWHGWYYSYKTIYMKVSR